MKSIFLFFVCFCLMTHLRAQSNSTAGFYEAVNQIFLTHPSNYLAPLDTLHHYELSSRSEPEMWSTFCQLMATYQSFIGNYKSSVGYYDSLSTPQPKTTEVINAIAEEMKGYRPIDAVKVITTLSQSTQAIIINESHHIPYHRLFVKSLLRDLYQNGYRYLALEALNYSKEDINKRKYPVTRDGFYINEPMFADLIRAAIAAGFKVVPYEDTLDCKDNCWAQRELNQAKNLCKIYEKDPSAKVLVYAGYEHILEKEKNGIKRMAEHFKQLSGIDPLTVNQNAMCEKSDDSYENKYYVAINKVFQINTPSILMKDDEQWISATGKGFYDIQVIHPRYHDSNGRAGYFSLDPEKKSVLINLKRSTGNYLIQAYFSSEKNGRIPIDQCVMSAERCYLMLPPGTFHIYVRDAANEIIQQLDLTL